MLLGKILEFIVIRIDRLVFALTDGLEGKQLAAGYAEYCRDVGPVMFGRNGNGQDWIHEIQVFGNAVFSSWGDTDEIGAHLGPFTITLFGYDGVPLDFEVKLGSRVLRSFRE